MQVSTLEILATALFAIAIIHTFSVPVFARLAHRNGPHAGLWHMFAEVEAVFGLWAFAFLVGMAALQGAGPMIEYMDTRNFTEPLFVFVIMVVASSRPIIELVGVVVRALARLLPVPRELALFFVTMSAVPLAGSFITEPAAMTLAALLLRDAYFRRPGQAGFKYLTLGVLFVNVSIGGVLTSYAAPPVLMVASTFGWDSTFMAAHFGWRAALAVVINASLLTLVCRRVLLAGEVQAGKQQDVQVPWICTLVHLAFLVCIVVTAHHPAVFLGLFLMFMGYTQAYKRFQSPLMLKEGLMVGFFLAGLVVLGGMQKWWLQDLLGGLAPQVLFWGATLLTAVTDNAALTYLGSLVDGTSEAWRYMLVAGAVTGGGLTVIANAPNPAGYVILKHAFPDGSISAGRLLLSALVPTAVAAAMFLLPV
ncbi:ABC-type multidrug transport system permease subunit [Kerstersia gyiorum]|uniref:putative Na+/H+ antiporter n=1 Tax=Kerstersia gyiorum TaxID=206506 RepID=UPI0020A150B8|nr:putative Na+/H+ antiporter [Kerstersia gyiorum]MCP1635425.1 ABC-type multidrug transport system permease subunit [Kerstersia gyiorum]